MPSLLDTANLDLASRPNTLPPELVSGQAATSSSSPSSSSSSAIPTYHSAFDLEGIPTELLIQVYSDRIFVLLTQLGRIGSLIQIQPPPPGLPSPLRPAPTAMTGFPSLPPPHPASTSTVLLGVAPSPRLAALYDLYAQQIAAIVFATESIERGGKPVVVGIALKPKRDEEGAEGQVGVDEADRSSFAQVLQEVIKGKIW